MLSRIAASSAEHAYGGAIRARTQVRLGAFAVGHDAGGILAQTLVAGFDGTLLSLASGNNDTVVRLGDPIPALVGEDGQGNDVWEWVVTYEYGIVNR